jgi:putative ABC transport system permease protein
MIRLALDMLRADRAKFFAMILAVALSVFLMQNQAAILSSIMTMTGSQIRDVPAAGLWVMEPDTECFDQAKPVRDTALYRVRGTDGVDWAVPLLKVDAFARSENGKLTLAVILGVDDSSLVGLPPRVILGDAAAIRERDTCLIDPGGYSLLFPKEPYVLGKRIRIADTFLRIVGISDASPPFTGFPIIHATRSTAIPLNRGEGRNQTFILGQLKPGADAAAVCTSIESTTGLKARTAAQFTVDSQNFYASQGVPMLFYIVIGIGLVVGAAITGQTFLMFVKENERHLSLMKVVGVTTPQMAGMLFCQAGLVVALGSCFGTGLATLTTSLSRTQPFLRGIYIPTYVAIATCTALAVVTAAAVLLALRNVQKLEPASVFRG